MPPLENDGLFEKAVLWPPTSVTDDFGNPGLDTSEEIQVRWEWKRGEFLDRAGNRIATDATVVVSKLVELDSLMWLGELADLPGTNFRPEANELMQVATYEETPDVKGRSRRRVVKLRKWMDRLPT